MGDNQNWKIACSLKIKSFHEINFPKKPTVLTPFYYELAFMFNVSWDYFTPLKYLNIHPFTL